MVGGPDDARNKGQGGRTLRRNVRHVRSCKKSVGPLMRVDVAHAGSRAPSAALEKSRRLMQHGGWITADLGRPGSKRSGLLFVEDTLPPPGPPPFGDSAPPPQERSKQPGLPSVEDTLPPQGQPPFRDSSPAPQEGSKRPGLHFVEDTLPPKKTPHLKPLPKGS